MLHMPVTLVLLTAAFTLLGYWLLNCNGFLAPDFNGNSALRLAFPPRPPLGSPLVMPVMVDSF